MSQHPTQPGSSPPANKKPAFLEWLPWETATIWGLFLLCVYVLRSFFFIIFMTFILAYIMRSIIVRITSLVSPHKQRAWLERSLSVVLFAALLFGLYNLGNYFGPRLIAQGEALVGRVTRGIQDNEFEKLKNRIVGPVLFRFEYPSENSQAYLDDFQEYQERSGGPRFLTRYHEFGGLLESLEGGFKDQVERREKRRLEQELRPQFEDEKAFADWLLVEVAPKRYEANREAYIANWEKRFLQLGSPDQLEALKQQENFEETRDNRILQTILEETKTSNPEDLVNLKTRYRNELLEAALERSLAETDREPEFKAYYESRREDDPETYPHEYDVFCQLREAYSQDEDTFASVIQQREEPLSEEELLEQTHEDFVLTRQLELAREWWSEAPLAVQLQDVANESIKKGFNHLGVWIQNTIGFLVAFPVQLGLSLLLSFFITFDIPKIRKGVRQLETSRLSDFYSEIAPGLMNFGRLMGRAFQAQGVIAFFNTFLTFLAIKFLGIQNEIFLCAIVFVCSFIPVLGVVLSSVPIAIMALVQEDGSLFLSIQIIAAILVIHFLETSVLNPKILGDMLHLHPVLVLAVLAIGEHFFGVWGLLLGVPVAVYIIRIVILNQGIPGIIENTPSPATPAASPAAPVAERSRPAEPPKQKEPPVVG